MVAAVMVVLVYTLAFVFLRGFAIEFAWLVVVVGGEYINCAPVPKTLSPKPSNPKP